MNTSCQLTVLCALPSSEPSEEALLRMGTKHYANLADSYHLVAKKNPQGSFARANALAKTECFKDAPTPLSGNHCH